MKFLIFNLQFLIILLSYTYTAFSQDLSKFSYKEIDSLVLIPEAEGDYATCLLYMAAGRKKALAEFGKMDSIYAKYTSDLGFFYYYLGQLKEAEPLFLETEKILDKKHPQYAMNLDNLSSLYQDIGNYEKSEFYALKSLDIRAKTHGEEDLSYARSLNNLAHLYQLMENYEKAEPLYLQSKNIRAKQLGEDHPSYATAINNLAGLYQDMHQYDDAEVLYLKCLNIRGKTDGKDHPDYAQCLNNLANLYYEMGKHKKAEPLFLQAKNIWSKSVGEEHPSFVATISNLALLYQALGDFSKAEKLYLQSKNLDVKNFGDKHPYVALSFNNLASLYLEMNQLDTALSYCRQSLMANSTSINSSFDAWGTLDQFNYHSTELINKSISTLSNIFQKKYKQTGDKKQLEIRYEIAQAAIRINERARNEFNGEKNKLRSLETNHKFVLEAIQSAVLLKKKDYPKAAFGFAELNKAVLLMDAAKTERAYKFGDLPDSLATQERALQKKQSDLKAILLENFNSAEKDNLQAELVRLNQEIDVFTKKLKTDYPKYAAIKYGNKTVNAAEIQALLDTKTALLEYVIGDSTVYIFYVDKEMVQLEEVAISHLFLSQKIKDFHEVLSNYELLTKESATSYRRYTVNAHWFYTNLVSPVLKHAKGISNLIIVSDGEIGHLPFESFLVELASQKETAYQKLHYLVQDYAISYNYSATIWKENKEQKKHLHNGQLFAMAANYDATTNANTATKVLNSYQQLRQGLAPLPVAREEVELLAADYDGFFAFDAEASEKNFKEKASDYAIIHLAMHGLLDSKAPILSSIVFTNSKDSSPSAVGDRLENDFLQAYEISKMQLNAELVVLSACETGYGKFEKGNGIASLAQAFAYAGAPAMIVSLWQVNDHATSEIMKRLYKNLAQDMNKDEALRQAKLQYISMAEGISAHPAFWSPFVLMGNTDAIKIGGTYGFPSTWVIGGGIMALGAIGFAMKRKK